MSVQFGKQHKKGHAFMMSDIHLWNLTFKTIPIFEVSKYSSLGTQAAELLDEKFDLSNLFSF